MTKKITRHEAMTKKTQHEAMTKKTLKKKPSKLYRNTNRKKPIYLRPNMILQNSYFPKMIHKL